MGTEAAGQSNWLRFVVGYFLDRAVGADLQYPRARHGQYIAE
jgi:hypothetical protein